MKIPLLEISGLRIEFDRPDTAHVRTLYLNLEDFDRLLGRSSCGKIHSLVCCCRSGAG